METAIRPIWLMWLALAMTLAGGFCFARGWLAAGLALLILSTPLEIVAGGSKKLARGAHTRVTGTVGDLYVTVADEVVGAGIGKFPTATRKMGALLT